MTDIPQREFEAILAARARGLPIGPPPVASILAGARRRTARRRVATALAGTLVLAGAASGMGLAFGRSAAPAPVPPGFHTSLPSPPSASLSLATLAGPRQVPRVTYQAGPAAGQKAPDGRQVLASGTSDGKPWQVTVLFVSATAANDPVFHPGTGPGAGGPCLELTYWLAGSMTAQGYSCRAARDHSPYSQSLNSTSTREWAFLVPENVVKVAWIGTDGFRQETAVLPARSYGGMGRLGAVVFPDTGGSPVEVGDRFVGYDAAGREVAEYMRIQH